MGTPRPNNDSWVIGLDIGYSGVKTFSPNACVCFPAFATKKMSERISIGQAEDNRLILYRDENGEEWEVGAMAQNSISVSDTSAGSMSIYGRSRYYSPMFKVLYRVGIAVGCRINAFGNPHGKNLKIETGLPPKYIRSDSADLKSVMVGSHKFSIKIGNGAWEEFSFTLNPEDIDIIDQPEGTLFSISTNPTLGLVPDAVKYFNSKILIVDPGFGTLDLFPMIRGSVNRDNCQTYTELGMKQVLKDTTDEILKECNFEISVPAFQQFLEQEYVLKKEGRKVTKVDFSDILEKHSRDICNKAIDRIIEIYNPTMEFDYLVLTAGTGAAWSNYFRNCPDFKDCDTLSIISGNQGDPTLPYIFSNVRGYYIFGITRFK